MGVHEHIWSWSKILLVRPARYAPSAPLESPIRIGTRKRNWCLEQLEPRILLSLSSAPASAGASTVVDNLTPATAASVNPIGLTPAEVSAAYGFDKVAFAGGALPGAGQTIAIVDEYYDPNLKIDLAAFDSAFNLPPPPSFIQLNYLAAPYAPAGDWGYEQSLDVEWAHALAPGASILLVNAPPGYVNGDMTTLYDAAHLAAENSGVSVVSMSFGSSEFGSEHDYDGDFTTPAGHSPVVFVAAAGDKAGTEYPAVSPNVLSVGGTSFIPGIPSGGSETVWNDAPADTAATAGGPSSIEGHPYFQSDSSNRITPDVAFDAGTGVAVYDSYDISYNDPPAPWIARGGTSFGAAAWAALIAIIDQARSSIGEGPLGGAEGQAPAPWWFYQLPTQDFNDITQGGNGQYSAAPGYDWVTGLGTPRVDMILGSIAGAAQPISATEFNPTSTRALNQSSVSVASDAAGDFAAVWECQSASGGFSVSGQLYSPSGTPIGTEFPALFSDSPIEPLPKVAMDSTGDFVIIGFGPDGSGGVAIYEQQFAASGRVSIGGAQKVNTTPLAMPTYPQPAALAMDAAGDFVVAWQSQNFGLSSLIYGRWYRGGSSLAVALTPEEAIDTVSTSNDVAPAAAMSASGESVIAWLQASENQAPAAAQPGNTPGAEAAVVARRFNVTNGGITAIDQSEMVLTQSGAKTSAVYESVEPLLSIAMNAAGVFVAAWEGQDQDGRGIYACQISIASSVTTPFLVNSATAGDQRRPSVTIDSAGGFVVAWDSGAFESGIAGAGDGSGGGVYLRAYDPTGQPMADQSQANIHTPNDQVQPSIIFRQSDRKLLAAWQSQDQDGSGNGIYARLIAAPTQPGDQSVPPSTGSGSTPTVAQPDGDFGTVAKGQRHLRATLDSSSHPQLVYALTVNNQWQRVVIRLGGLRNNADLELLDANNNVIAGSHHLRKQGENINLKLAGGTYYIKASLVDAATTPFDLNLQITPLKVPKHKIAVVLRATPARPA